VLGFVTAGLTLLMSIAYLGGLDSSGENAAFAVLLLGIPCAAGMILGGVQVLRRSSSRTLLTSAIAAVVVLILALIVGLGTLSDPGAVVGLMVLLVLAAPLPVVTACLAGGRTVSTWIAARTG
jgi:hypothetical protein